MPELPEVETVRIGLVPVLEGRSITAVRARRGGLRIPFPRGFAKRLTGRRVVRLGRRAKYLLAELDDGQSLVMHLGMSGRMSVYTWDRAMGRFGADPAQGQAGRGKHDHVVIETDAPARVVFTDQRRFGLMTLIRTSRLEAHPLFKGLGMEPLSDAFDAEALARALAGKRAPIKSALLDQRVLAGLGNIYACEALFRAHIPPWRRAATIARRRCTQLAQAITDVLREALNAGGSSLRDHKRVDGGLGEFQHRFAVYDREGEFCRNNCGGRIKRIVQSGRSTFYCQKCQR